MGKQFATIHYGEVVGDLSDKQRQLVQMRKLASLLDDRFTIPQTNIRFGLDAIIGLVPGFGDALGSTLSLFIIYRAAQLGARKRVLLRMCGNVVVDFFIGLVPLFGDLADVAWKANRKNVKLATAELENSPSSSSRTTQQVGSLFLTSLLVAFILMVGCGVWLLVLLFQAIS